MNIGKTGAAGEKAAVDYLKKKKYKILSQNYQTYFGELDIVCQYGEFIVFVEVKTRTENYLISGIEAVDISKRKKIIRAASQYLQSYKPALQPRFDVVEIIVGKDGETVNHIENAFDTRLMHGFF